MIVFGSLKNSDIGHHVGSGAGNVRPVFCTVFDVVGNHFLCSTTFALQDAHERKNTKKDIDC
jgi:hypothetical protein